ncbi:Uncharacterised protein [Candidatus Gugararchaeum adminiculabundum]|nr:Uncharacterised protein [Candidatus Gugararchaeum adminiculabundum]
MAVLNQNLPDDLTSKFNEAAREKFGDKKGCKRSALIEAIGDWLKKEKITNKVKK